MEVTQSKKAWERQREIHCSLSQERILREEHEKKQRFEEISFLKLERERENFRKFSKYGKRKILGTFPKEYFVAGMIFKIVPHSPYSSPYSSVQAQFLR